MTVRRVPKNRKTVEPQPAAEETSDFQDFGFSKRLGELFPHSGFGKRLGEPVRESTEREERLIDQKVELKAKLNLEVPESTARNANPSAVAGTFEQNLPQLFLKVLFGPLRQERYPRCQGVETQHMDRIS